MIDAIIYYGILFTVFLLLEAIGTIVIFKILKLINLVDNPYRIFHMIAVIIIIGAMVMILIGFKQLILNQTRL